MYMYMPIDFYEELIADNPEKPREILTEELRGWTKDKTRNYLTAGDILSLTHHLKKLNCYVYIPNKDIFYTPLIADPDKIYEWIREEERFSNVDEEKLRVTVLYRWRKQVNEFVSEINACLKGGKVCIWSGCVTKADTDNGISYFETLQGNLLKRIPTNMMKK